MEEYIEIVGTTDYFGKIKLLMKQEIEIQGCWQDDNPYIKTYAVS